LWLLVQNKKPKFQQYNLNDDLPFVSILVAAHNEEAVISKKIGSIYSSNYPLNRLELIIGSDCSTDSTNQIINDLVLLHPSITFIEFTDRQGKIGVMNQLVDKAKGEVIISTDANVFFTPTTIFELVKYFKDSDIGLVDTRMLNTGLKKEGISIQESAYITREVAIKHREGILWGSMIGPFGGCYAIRKDCYHKPPINSLVDDFYINMKVLENDKKCVSSKEAVVYEDVSNILTEEFRRKVRISMGNFQNLKRFRRMLWPPTKPVAFAFLSHKVLRWFGPFLILFSLISSAYLSFQSQFFLYALLIQLVVLSLPIFDLIFRNINIHILLLRFATHFFSMNLALLIGLIKYLKGVNSNVWQPTQRNQ
jgi:cellulose synthase/poly-beta-1,6-N-acetylglucosamine synthase-like glycosyltransferase